MCLYLIKHLLQIKVKENKKGMRWRESRKGLKIKKTGKRMAKGHKRMKILSKGSRRGTENKYSA